MKTNRKIDPLSEKKRKFVDEEQADRRRYSDDVEKSECFEVGDYPHMDLRRATCFPVVQRIYDLSHTDESLEDDMLLYLSNLAICFYNIREQHDERSNDSSVPAGIETRTGLSDFSTVEDGSDVVVSQEPKDIGISKYDPIDTEEAIQEASSDESWQEASSKVRTGHAASRKFGRRCPDLAKLKISKNEYNNPRETSHRREAMFIRQKATPRTISTKPSKKRHTKVLCSSAGDDTPILQAKTSVSKFSTMQIPKVSPTSSSLTAMASKSLSYKEVAVSPPGTVRKPLLEKGDKSNEVKTDTQICHSSSEKSKKNGSMRVTLEEAVPDNEAAKDHISEAPEAATESEEYGEQVLKLGCSGNQDNSVETTRSKLSAEATHFCHVKVVLATRSGIKSENHYITFQAFPSKTGVAVTFQTHLLVNFLSRQFEIMFVRIKPSELDQNKSKNKNQIYQQAQPSGIHHDKDKIYQRRLSRVIGRYTIGSGFDSQYSLAFYLSQYALFIYNFFTLSESVAKHDIESLKVVKLTKPNAEVPTFHITYEAPLIRKTKKNNVETFKTEICMPSLFPTTVIQVKSGEQVITG